MSIDKLLEEADEDPYAFGPAGVKQLAAEVRRLREREKVLTEALETALEAMKERRDYCEMWEYKYGGIWDSEDIKVRSALAFDKPPIA